MKIKSIHILFLFLCLGVDAQNTITYQCILRSNSQKDTMCDGKVIPVFGITSTLGEKAKIPAKILYCNEGDSVVLNTRSISQNEHHTIHLHGLDVDTRNDGDPSTSFWLEHMQDTTYSFKAKHAGTYLYHCHVADVVHVQMGMYGMIVVRPVGGVKTAWTGGPAYDKDYKWLMSEVDSTWHYNVPYHDTLADTVHIPKYEPNYFLINGKCGGELFFDDSIKISGAQGEKILVRLANIGFNTNRIIFPSYLNAKIIDSDGRPLPAMIVNDTCYVMPGERFSVMIESSMQSAATVSVQYVDMNTGNILQTNNVQVNISGVIGIKEKNKNPELIKIFPNPASEDIFIESYLSANEKLEYRVFNSLGQLQCNSFFENETRVNISKWSQGLYLIAVYRDNIKVYSKSVIKAR